MKSVQQLIVSISLGGKEREVGELVTDGRKIYFRYYPAFLATGWEISPFKLPLSPGVLTADTPIFDGLFGVFNDSLPDGWGRLLLDRSLVSKGISPSGITPLDRLSFIGCNGMGALMYRPAVDSVPDLKKQLELDAIANDTRNVLEGTSTTAIEELYHLGGSSGGARPKIFVGYHPEKDHILHGEENLPEGYEHWIIKFGTSTDPMDMAEIEFAYHKMALDAGIDMSQCRLFTGISGRKYFGTKRFDRMGKERIHVHSAAGLMHDNFRLSNMDYGHLMDAAYRLENDINAYEKVIRIAAFNIFAHNRDDHSKNLSFLMDQNGKWKLAPAYDLTFSSSAQGFHSTTIAGEGKSPSSKNLLELAEIFGVKNAKNIIGEVKEVTRSWMRYAKEYGVRTDSAQIIGKTIEIIGKG